MKVIHELKHYVLQECINTMSEITDSMEDNIIWI
jgi:Zn-dependent peptidase ImmA (M78 family)